MAKAAGSEETPMMKQYLALKARVPDAVLLYRMGDFFETFNEDAQTVARILGITLTTRGGVDRTPLAGFPHHQIDRYLPKLVSAGCKVAVCEQTEDPAQAKGIVKRDIVEVVTRGTTLNEACLDERTDNLLGAIAPAETADALWGLGLLDLSTGRFEACEGSQEEILAELERSGPVELLWPEYLDRAPEELAALEGSWSLAPSPFPAPSIAKVQLCEQLGTTSLEGFGWSGNETAAFTAAAAALRYAGDDRRRNLSHLRALHPRVRGGFLVMDGSTLRNLEVLRPLHDDDVRASLAGQLDRCRTSMGSRQLRRWLARPLCDLDGIGARQQAVEALRAESTRLWEVQKQLNEISDLERLAGRIATGRCHARDLVAAGKSLVAAQEVGRIAAELSVPLVTDLVKTLDGASALGQPLLDAFVDAPPLSVKEGGLLRPGYDPVCAELSEGAKEGREKLAGMQEAERARTGISTLKVGYNRVFGYYIEISNANRDRDLPYDYQRTQTLTNAERYVTPELKKWEELVMGAEERIQAREHDIFCQLRDCVAAELSRVQEIAQNLASLDVLSAFAECAEENRWVRPDMILEGALRAAGLRHPVLEALHPQTPFVPNDVEMDPETSQLQLVTGPNMGGKSTYLRQVGILAVMAHAGCPVAADAVTLPLLDRVFTRVGAADRLSRGQSTFLVEMLETSNILHNATPRSLVLLDEVGRGTSTFDGLSLAWGIVEALHEEEHLRPLTLFATHYHELTVLADRLPRVKNLQVKVREHEGRIVFLHRVLEGTCDSSYGLHVARMAGVPEAVLKRAQGILLQLEAQELRIGKRDTPKAPAAIPQLSLFASDPGLEEIGALVREADPMQMTPMQALIFVQKLKDRLEP